MKILFLSIFVSTILLFSGCDNASNDGNRWEEKIEIAAKIAKSENKAILVNFTGSDWCVWCKKLDKEVFSQQEFKDFVENNLVLVKIDFPRSIQQSSETKVYNAQTQIKYKVEGYPTIVLLDSDGNYVNTTGYQEGGAKSYVEHLKTILKKS